MHKSKVLRSLLGATLAIVLLIPVPAMGLTFLGSWRFFSSATGGTVGGFTGQFGSDAPGNYGLTVGMGQVDPPSNVSKYSVTATRDFQITNTSELIRISHSFGSTIRGGSINVSLTIQRYGVPNDPFNFPPYSFSAPQSGPPGMFAGLDDFSRTGFLQQGLYRVSITLTYTRTVSSNSSWNNSSPHQFNFSGQ